MKFNFIQRHKRAGGFTLPEMMVGAGLGFLLLAVLVSLGVYVTQTFAVIGNYEDLDRNSCDTLDVVSRELRNSSALVGFTNGATVKALRFTNSTTAKTVILTYNANLRTLVLEKTGDAPKTCLTGCDQWNFTLCNRVPIFSSTNITFYSATNGAGQLDAARCKLVNMSWKCSRTIIGSALTTESVQTAQIVLRNKVD